MLNQKYYKEKIVHKNSKNSCFPPLAVLWLVLQGTHLASAGKKSWDPLVSIVQPSPDLCMYPKRLLEDDSNRYISKRAIYWYPSLFFGLTGKNKRNIVIVT